MENVRFVLRVKLNLVVLSTMPLRTAIHFNWRGEPTHLVNALMQPWQVKQVPNFKLKFEFRLHVKLKLIIRP